MAINTEDSKLATNILASTENPSHIDSNNDDVLLSGYSLPTIPELTKSSQEPQSSLTRSQYALVVFHGVADTYPTDSDIVCRYSLTDGVEAVPGDRVVLFAVGWSSLKDYVTFEWAPIPEKDQRDLTVVFKAADLPKDVNEFYQVCYVSNDNAVCGASVPFQVRTPNNEELTFALEEDMVVVRSSTAVAQEKLLQAQLDRENFNKHKVNLEKELRSLEDKHSLTLRRLDRLQETLSTSNTLNEELKKENARLSGINEQMSCVQKELEQARMKLDDAEQEKTKMQEDAEALTTLARDYNVKVNHFQLRVKDLEVNGKDLEDRLIAATNQMETLIKERKILQNEVVIAHGNFQQSEYARADLATKNFALDNELTVCKFNLNNAQLESLRLEAELEDATKNNTKLNEQLQLAKKSEETHKSFYAQYSSNGNDRGRLIMENTRLQRTMEDMQLRISTLEHEKTTLEQVLEDTLDVQKNVCSDHCNLEKRVAQLQYRLDEASSNEQAVKNKQSCSYTNSSLPSEDKVKILAKLLDDQLKENELRVQENMALRLQNEYLETNISVYKSKSEDFVNLPSFESLGGFQHISTAQSQLQTIRTGESNAEIEKLQQRLVNQQELTNEYAERLTDKDKEIQKLHCEINALKTEFLNASAELKLEVANLSSKNASLVEQEIQSQELNNKMQKITFMNEELLVQNASLMARIHEDKETSAANTDLNMSQKIAETQNVYTNLEIVNKQLREELESTRKQLNQTEEELQEYKDNFDCMNERMCNKTDEYNHLQRKYSLLHEQHDKLLQRLTDLGSKVDGKCRHECRAEPKLEEISQSVEHILSALQRLAGCNEAQKDKPSTSLDADELKYRLQLAREEYAKLHTIMVNYRTKYTELKRKYYMKKAEKSHHFST